MSDNKVQIGPGFCGSLTIALIVLKLIEKITWSWFVVFAPIWFPLGIGLLVIIILLIVAFFKSL